MDEAQDTFYRRYGKRLLDLAIAVRRCCAWAP